MNKGFKIEGWLIESWESGPLVKNYQIILTNTVDYNLNFSIIRTNSKSPKIILKSSHIHFILFYKLYTTTRITVVQKFLLFQVIQISVIWNVNWQV